MDNDFDEDDGMDAEQERRRRRAMDVAPPPVRKTKPRDKAFKRQQARDRRRPQKPGGIQQRRIKKLPPDAR